MKPTRGGRRAFWTGIVLIAGALTATGVWLALPRDPLLMEVARPLVHVDTRKQELCWLSAHQLLIVTTEEEPGYTEGRNGSLATAPWQGSADVLDTTTHTKTHIAALTSLLTRTTPPEWGALNGFEMSPDGVWLQWASHFQRGTSLPSKHLARLDGSHYREWRPYYYEDGFFPDTLHLVQIEGYEPMMMICDLQNPRNDREYRNLEQAKTVLAQYAIGHPVFIKVSEPNDNLRQGSTEIDTYRMEDRIQMLISSWNERAGRARNPPRPIRTHELVLPTGTELVVTAVSPQQESILYNLRISQTNPLLSWLHRILPNFSTKPTDRFGLWVSGADGHGMHEIGSVPSPDSAAFPLGDIHWLPDGKQISFFYHDTLYVVPAEPEK